MNANLPKPLMDFQKIQKAFSNAIRDPEKPSKISGIDNRHMNVYRELFFNNVQGFILGGFPVLMELLSKEQQIQLVRAFFNKHHCNSPYFLKISEEFLQFLPECALDFLPEFSYQLAHWEWMELHADVYQNSKPINHVTTIDIDNDILTIIESAWCQAYDYPVHKISSENSVVAGTSFLMVYRDESLNVGFNELNPLSALLFERLKNNLNLNIDAILQEIALQQKMNSQPVIEGGRQIIQQWCQLGLLTLAS